MSKQSLIDYDASRRGLKCTHESVTRAVSHVVSRPNGIVWGECGWLENDSTHGVHLLVGKVTGKGPWRINGLLFEAITENDTWEIFGAFDAIWQREKKEKRDYSAECRVLLDAFSDV